MSPRAAEDRVRPRLCSGAGVRPLNFTVRSQGVDAVPLQTRCALRPAALSLGLPLTRLGVRLLATLATAAAMLGEIGSPNPDTPIDTQRSPKLTPGDTQERKLK